MEKLLIINESMNAFRTSVHNGPRHLYDDLVFLQSSFSRIKKEDVALWPIGTLAIERGEEAEYVAYEQQLNSISDLMERSNDGRTR